MSFRFLIVLFLVGNGIYAQLAEIHLTYEFNFSVLKVIETNIERGHLFIFKDHSIYYTDPNSILNSDKDSIIRLPTDDEFHIRVYTIQKRNKDLHGLLVQTNRSDEMLSYANIKLKRRSKNYFVREKILQIEDWQLHDTTKEIAGFVCSRATTNFGGRFYEAWYSLDIPTNIGPWKIHGLPGAIVSVEDSAKEVSFKLVRVEYDKFIPQSKRATFPTNVETISCNQLMGLRKEELKRRKERIEALSDRDMTITVNSNVMHHIQKSCD